MKRSEFVKTTGLLTAGLTMARNVFAGNSHGLTATNTGAATGVDFPVVRVAAGKRHFESAAIEEAISTFGKNVSSKELAWLFNNCFPNTLDTTVTHTMVDGRPDTYVITGDIDAMWMRDSTAQVWPYLAFAKKDAKLQQLIAGVINRQAKYIIKDPYANAFYNDPEKQGEWKTDSTDMKKGVHERKWEIDSLCYPLRLAWNYWKTTGDVTVFEENYLTAIRNILATFKDQQRKTSDGSYHFQRTTPHATDTLSMSGFGNPVNPVGLICSAFRPSDDATVFSFLVPSNFFAVKSLGQAAEIVRTVYKDEALATELTALASEVKAALAKYAVTTHPVYGKVYAFETDGFGNHYLMDDANIPSLLAMPYLGTVSSTDPVYLNTRRMVLSKANPFYYEGTAAAGIGGPHVGKDMIWPMSLIIRGMTSNNDKEIRYCVETLRKTHAGTGFMHESFHKDNPEKFTRSWFAWANTLFGEFLWKVYREKKHLLS